METTERKYYFCINMKSDRPNEAENTVAILKLFDEAFSSVSERNITYRITSIEKNVDEIMACLTIYPPRETPTFEIRDSAFKNLIEGKQ